MHEDYCFKCGAYEPIDEVTTLCGPCYGDWPDEKRSGEPEWPGRRGQAVSGKSIR